MERIARAVVDSPLAGCAVHGVTELGPDRNGGREWAWFDPRAASLSIGGVTVYDRGV